MSEENKPWTELYRPKNLGEVVGNEDAIESLRDWFDAWSPKAKRKVAILHGPAGTGKTSSVVALANERGYELVEMNASDKRNKKAILQIVGSSAKEGTIDGGSRGKRILLIDEVDGITGREDRGGVTTLVRIVKDASVPIICTANKAYDKKLKKLRKIGTVIRYKPVHEEYILKVLKKISKNQKSSIELDNLKFLAENAGGDLRSAINDLQSMVLQLKSGKITEVELLKPYRNQTKELETALSDLFHAKSFLDGKRAIEGVDIKYDELLLWVFENAHYHVSEENLPQMYETIATADRFLGRIRRRQKWILLKYFFDLISGGVAVEVDKTKYMKKYVYPQKIALYARTMFSRAITKSISQNIAEKIHVSQSAAATENLYLVKDIINSNIGDAAKLAYWLELDDNQIKNLLDDRAKLKKIKKVMQALEDERIKQQTKMGKLKYSRFDDPGDDWSEVLEGWEKRKALEKEKEKEQKQKKKKSKSKSKKKASTEDEKAEKKFEDKNQASLDQFF